MAGLEHPNPVSLDVERVRQAFEGSVDRAKGETFEFRRERPDFNIGGLVVREAFREAHVTERQRWIWNPLDSTFGEASREIDLVLAFTPEEYAEYLADF